MACLGASFVLPAPASSSLIPISQTRQVEVTGYLIDAASSLPPLTDSDSATAPDFGPFSESAEIHLTMGIEARLDADASQQSVIGSSQITVVADASVLVRPHDYGPSEIGGEGRARSSFALTFDLPSDGLWAFDAVATGADVEIYFEGPEGPLYYGGAFGGFEEEFSETFALSAGRYGISASAAAQSLNRGDESAFSLSLTQVPEPGTGALLMLGVTALGRVRGRSARR